MDAPVIGDLLPRDRRRDQPALVVPAVDREMSYRDFFTTAYKAGNVLRFLGVGEDRVVAIDPTPAPEPLLAFLGAAQLGAEATFDPAADARLRLVPVDRENAYEAAGETKLAVYGGPPASAATVHWEQQVWSENPGFPPTAVDPESTVLRADEATFSHRELLSAAEGVVTELGLAADERLAIRLPLSSPAAIVGLLAALTAEATAVVVGESARAVDADAAVVANGVRPPEAASIAAEAVGL